MDSPAAPRADRVRWGFAALAFALYLGLSFRLGERYPSSDYAMFAHGGRWASEVLARDAAGTIRPVFDFEGFACTFEPRERFTSDPARGLDAALVPVEESVLAYIEAHPATEGEAGGEPVELFRRLWVLGENARVAGPSGSFDLPVARCTARRSPDGGGLGRLAWYFNR